MKRVAIYQHFDVDDMIDDHVVYTLTKLNQFGCDILFISNSKLPSEEIEKIQAVTTEITLRKNVGLDYAAWKQVVLSKGKEHFKKYDQVIFLNCSIYGPLFPLDEIFSVMENKRCDFWGVTSWKHYIPHLLDVQPHLQPYFLVVNRSLHEADAFWNYWESTQEFFSSYWDAVINGEVRMSLDWEAAGFKKEVYIDGHDCREMEEIGIVEPYSQNLADFFISRYRMPFVKVKSFCKNDHRPLTITQDIFSALKVADSEYPIDIIENHLRRTTPLSWHKNIPSTFFVPSISGDAPDAKNAKKIGVFAHFFYPDMFEYAIKYLKNIPCKFDLFITTGNDDAVGQFREMAKNINWNLDKLSVKKVVNRGRDYAPWLLEFREEHLKYDIALKIQLKKHSQQPEAFGYKWNQYLYEGLLQSTDFVSAVISKFENSKKLGVMFPPYPPLVTLVAPVAYMGSPAEQRYRQKVFDDLSISPPEETASYVFSAGSMFWYRPAALKKLLTWDINYKYFPSEPISNEGSISHGIERAIPYVAQSEGYSYALSMPLNELVAGYQMYEDRLMSHFVSQHDVNKATHKLSQTTQHPPTIQEAAMEVILSISRSYRRRFPIMSHKTLKVENAIGRVFRKLLKVSR